MIDKLKTNYAIWHVNQVRIPTFNYSLLVRKNIIFYGKVQKVGFRLEIYCLAKRLGLTGVVENLEDGNVEATLQGSEVEIDFLIKKMIRLKRARVKDVKVEYIPKELMEEGFKIIK